MMAQDLSWKCPRSVAYGGLLLLALYAALRVLWPAVSEPAGTAMALFGLIALLVWGKGLKGSAALWLLLAVIGVQILSWVLGYFHHPEWVSSNPEVDRLAKLFIFIGVAWWLGGSTRLTLALWLAAVVGYVIASFVSGGLEEWRKGLEGMRTGFGIRNNQHGSMLFGVCLVGLVVFARRIFMHSGRGRLPLMFVWAVLILVSLTGVLIGQTRAVWLALCIAAVFGVAVRLIWLAKFHGARHMLRSMVVVFCVLFIVCLGALYTFKDTLSKRVGYESDVVEKLIDGEVQKLPYNSSLGIRIHTWVAAGEWIAERPLVGWGGEGRGLVIDHTDWLPDNIKKRFGHLHNFFLEVWVAYGLLGIGVIAALAFWIGRGTWLSWRAGVMPGDIALFGASFFVYWVIVNQFESYNSFWTGVYVHNLVVGGLVTHIWRWQLDTGRRIFSWPRRRGV